MIKVKRSKGNDVWLKVETKEDWEYLALAVLGSTEWAVDHQEKHERLIGDE